MALSSDKIHKYEYLTGEDILPSNQQQIIEQAKFTYSLFRKAFEKQIKAIKDQGEKQINAIQDQRQVKAIKKYTYAAESTSLISKQKEIFHELVDERLEKILNLDEKVNSDGLIYRYKGKTAVEKIDNFDNALSVINKIKNGEISLADVKNNQDLSEVKRAHSTEQKSNNHFVQY